MLHILFIRRITYRPTYNLDDRPILASQRTEYKQSIRARQLDQLKGYDIAQRPEYKAYLEVTPSHSTATVATNIIGHHYLPLHH